LDRLVEHRISGGAARGQLQSSLTFDRSGQLKLTTDERKLALRGVVPTVVIDIDDDDRSSLHCPADCDDQAGILFEDLALEVLQLR
jgi:hypothetical protein